jgi:hypothetical protein
MLQKCLQKAINETEYMKRGLTPRIAEDLSDRINLKTGHKIHADTLYNIYRTRPSEKSVSIEDKNALAQFAQFHNWEHFVQVNTHKISHPHNFQFVFYIAFFMLSIFILIHLIRYFFL